MPRPTTVTGLFTVALLPVMAVLSAPPAQASTDECADGVSVVVDFTDLGGDVVTACASGDPASGREALESAGFDPVDSSPGLICTIDDYPEVCPTEFDGNFWSYWQLVDGEWVSSPVGADESDPAPGDIEGWRYSDGTLTPPLPGDPAAESSSPESVPESVAEATDGDAVEQGSDDGAEQPGGDLSTGALIGIAAVIMAVAVVIVLLVRRRQ
ncbi:MAG: hypothetical protein ACK5H2_14280 [Beutenbergiaceae bacterium]